MSRLHQSFVLGYHGCERETGLKALNRELNLIQGEEQYHWLGSGIYFWEEDPMRAWEWAHAKKRRKRLTEPFVIGAIIDLGNCLDLQTRENIELLKTAYTNYALVTKRAGLEMPVNRKAPKDKSEDKVMRFLDCAVINHLHAFIAENDLPKFDTVRGFFGEGLPIYAGSGFREKTHSEIAVCNPACIKGVFLPPT